SYVGQIRHAGGVFVGTSSPEAAGDYVAGPSHVMPTGGTARFASPLSVDDFVKVVSVVGLTPSRLAEVGPVAARLARAEGFEAHARAVELRLTPRGAVASTGTPPPGRPAPSDPAGPDGSRAAGGPRADH